ncbi:MAG: hypothetical protein DYG89_49600 [Caldilinea sp. CFX5]|nr:hypothetical protein [Caldilinea sp. CFX5]
MTTDQLAISLLGDFKLTYNCQSNNGQSNVTELHTVNTARLQALLGYLLLHRQAPQAREHLAFLFWPDTSEAQALTNLRNLLYKLRHALPTPERFLLVEARFVQWQPDAPYTLDVAAFEAAAAQAATAADLASAIELYSGELLPSCYDDWILPERERLRQLALDTLERLIALLEGARDYRAAIRYGQRLLQLEPLNEALYRRLMSLHAAVDDRAGALHVYQRCVTMLHEEFAAEPAPATQEIYQRLQRMATTPPPSTTLRSPEQPPLIGRTTEWQALLDAWRRASRGQCMWLLLTGVAGIGKTRLAEEVTTWVARQGYGVATAHCYAAEGALAYAPVVAWLRADFVYKQLAALAPVWRTEVARLLPELLTLQPNLPAPGPLTPGWQRQRFFEALARALLNGKGPRILLLDDLQWCDPDTLTWLHYLAHFVQEPRSADNGKATPSRSGLLLVGTLRQEEVGDQHPVQDLLLSLRRAEQVTELALGPLDATETAALAAAIAGQALTPDQSANLYQETEGNPLFVVETVRAQRGAWRTPAAPASTPPDLPPTTRRPLPPKVHAVIHARLSELSPTARELAGVAATIGRAFPFAVLAQAGKQDEEALVDNLDELCQRQIVRERSADSYDFTHDKLREVIYNSLSAARRRLLHKRVADALEAVYTNPHGNSRQPLATVSGQIATHYELAGVFEKAIHHYQQAAEAAHQLSANGEAVRAYRRAIALVEGPAGQQPAVTLYERLGDLLHGMSQYAEARAVFTQALAYVAMMDAVQCARCHRKIGNTWREQYDYANALQFYTAAAAALEHAEMHAPYRTTQPHLPADHPHLIQIQAAPKGTPAWWEEWLQTQLEIDLVHYWLGETAASAALQQRLAPLIEQHATPGQQAAFFQRQGQLEFRRERSVATAAAVAHVQRSFAIYQDAGMQDNLPSAHFMLGFMLLWHDEPAAATAELQTTLRLAEQQGDLSLQARALTYLTIAARRRNQMEECQTLAAQALAVATTAHMPEYIALARANLAWLAWRRRDDAAVRTHGGAALARWQQLPVTHASAPFQWTALWPLLAEALQRDDVAAAVGYAHTLLDPHQQQLPDILATVLMQALQAWESGATDEVQRQLHEAVSLAEQHHYL